MISSSCFVSVLFVFYILLAMFNLYRLMYPLTFVNLASVPKNHFVRSMWEEASQMKMKVYLSSQPMFLLDFLSLEYPTYDSTRRKEDTVLLWEQELKQASLSKSFLLTTLNCEKEDCQRDESYNYASNWLDHAEHLSSAEDAGLLSKLSASAGEGIESTSVLLAIYNTVFDQVRKVLSMFGMTSDETDEENEPILRRSTVSLPSAMWSTLQSNSTLHVHVLVEKQTEVAKTQEMTFEQARAALGRASQSYSVLLGYVGLVKYEVPHHIGPPKRVLYNDITYLFQRYIAHSVDKSARPPWDTAYSKPKEHAIYQRALDMKNKGAGYPYWKPEVAVKYVNDDVSYPLDYVDASGMEVVQLRKTHPSHPTGWAFMPQLHVDEIGLTSEKYIPINVTLTSLPLRITVDRSDMEHHERATTATEGGLGPARWRLLSHLSKSLESQKKLGFEQSDIDDLRRLIADTNVTLLAITVLASGLHLLFEFLTFKSDVSFWRSNKDLTGLSVRSLFLDMIGQVIILLFLIEKDSSLLVTVPAAIGCLIALWKCQRGAGFKFVRKDKNSTESVSWWNIVPGMFGYELRATRLHVKAPSGAQKGGKSKEKNAHTSQNLAALTIETDRIATRTLGSFLLPVVIGYAVYSFVMEEHTGWYSWLITSASSAVYAFGFVLMTPQLFLNYKLKSVAHLPWRVLGYKFINTFIDDLFAFIIRMPAMTRLSCFRDDIVFIIYLYQRWLYPVDTSRPVEGVGDAGSSRNTSKAETSERKKKQ